jgi:hypothetical protein
MRTTLTLDPDVVRLIKDAARRERRSTKEVINDALRRALRTGESTSEPYQLTPHESAVRPGLDLSGFNKLADELEDKEILAVTQRPS